MRSRSRVRSERWSSQRTSAASPACASPAPTLGRADETRPGRTAAQRRSSSSHPPRFSSASTFEANIAPSTPPGALRNPVPAPDLVGPREHPVRHDRSLRRAPQARGPSDRRARRRCGERKKSAPDRPALPPCGRGGRTARRLRRRTRDQAGAARARGLPIRRRTTRVQITRFGGGAHARCKPGLG